MMKSLLTASAAILLASGAPAFAQESTAPMPSEEAQAPQYVGQSVYDATGQEVGVIEGIVIADDGSEQAVLSVGGFLGLGAKKIAVATTDLEAKADGSGYTIALTADDIEAAPAYAPDGAVNSDSGKSM